MPFLWLEIVAAMKPGKSVIITHTHFLTYLQKLLLFSARPILCHYNNIQPTTRLGKIMFASVNEIQVVLGHGDIM